MAADVAKDAVGAKDRVFVAALRLPIDPDTLVAAIVDGPRHTAGERLLRLFLALWTAPEPSAAFLALLRSVSTSEQAAAMLRGFLEHAVLSRVTEALGIPRLAATAMAAQLIGLVLVRYVVGVEPMASATDDEVVALVAPALQTYLTARD